MKFSIYFTNHLNQKIKIDDNIVDIEDGVFDIEVGKLYNSLTFVVREIYIDPLIIGDGVERIEVRYIDDVFQEEIIEKFVIEGVDFIGEYNIKVFCKSKTIKYSKIRLNSVIPANSAKELINSLIEEANTDKLTDIPFVFDYKAEDESIEEIIDRISQITGFEYYYFRGVVYFEDKRRVDIDDKAVKRFTEVEDIIEFSTTTYKDNIVNELIINQSDEDNTIEATPALTLEINPSPQPCSPLSMLVYTDDDGNSYKLSPVNAYFFIYFSPSEVLPKCNVNFSVGERVLIEEFELNNDEYVELMSGIEEIIAIDGVENYQFQNGYNLLTFDKVDNGYLKITYKTKVLYGTIPASKYPKTINFYITHFDRVINYNHKFELKGYYPLDFNLKLSLVKDFGFDYESAINRSFGIYKLIDGNWSLIESVVSNNFGEIDFYVSSYGTYRFELDEPVYMDYYVNKMSIYKDEIEGWNG